ncbi:MAG: SRPBCC family protein [Jatrophihabitans sp.]|uniref:SRPBCC family protein n=1 Tax=Jatrophihabitans sp. TaxID=1932789 RepID=UPI003F7F1388
MGTITLHAEGDATPDVAWTRYAEPGLWRTWSPQITGVEIAAPRIVAGLTGRVVGPLGVRVPFVIDEVDEAARRWTWHVPLGPVRIRLVHWIEPAGGGSRTGLAMHGPLPLLLGYAPLARFALGRLVRA